MHCKKELSPHRTETDTAIGFSLARILSFRKSIMPTKSFILWIAVLAVPVITLAADFHWTGNAGDCLWSSAGNWANSDGTPKTSGPESGKNYSYNFTGFADGLVVTQDIDVVTSLFAVRVAKSENYPQAPRQMKWVSAKGKTLRFVTDDAGQQTKGRTEIYVDTNARLILECDMSADNGGGPIHVQPDYEGYLAFKLLKPNGTARLMSINPNHQYQAGVEFLEGGAMPKLAIESYGAQAVVRNYADNAEVYSIVNPKENDHFKDSLGRVDTSGASLTIGSETNLFWNAINNLAIPLVARDGYVKVRGERTVAARSLPIGGSLECTRADYVLSGNPLTVLSYEFNDPANPLSDKSGAGERMLTPKGMPSVVEDAERGKVLRFEGAKCLMGPDENAGLRELNFQIGYANAYSIAFWIKPDATCDKKARVFFVGKNASENLSAFLMRFDNSRNIMISNGRDYFQSFDCGIDFFAGSWHHVAVVYNGYGVLYLYVDGELVGTRHNVSEQGNVASIPNENFYIGAVYGGWGNTPGEAPFTGLMDDLIFTQYSLNGEDVASLYNEGLKQTIKATDIRVNSTGTISFPERDVAVGALSGNSLLGGIEMRGEGKTLRVGADEVGGETEFKGKMRGGAMSLLKEGAGYALAIAGSAENVTNIVVKEGTLEVRRPLTQVAQALHFSFDDAENLLRDSGVGALTLPAADTAIEAIADGVKGGAIRFTGDTTLNSGTQILPSNFPLGNDGFTVFVWIRPTAAACENRAPIVSWGKNEFPKLTHIRFQTATQMLFANGGTEYVVVETPKLDDGSWHHIAAVYNAGTRNRYFYVDGKLCSNVADGHLSVEFDLQVDKTEPFQLAMAENVASVASVRYTGDMDELTICNRAWSAEDVSSAYSLALPALAAPESVMPAPVARWTFDSDEAPGADYSGNGYNLTAAGGAISLEATPLSNGKALRIGPDTGYFKLDSVPSTFPLGNPSFTIAYRVLADANQTDGKKPTVVTLGNAANWNAGELLKFSVLNGMLGLGFTIGNLFEDWEDKTKESNPQRNDYFRFENSTERQRWMTVAVSRLAMEGNKFRLQIYIDGELVKSMDMNEYCNIQAQDFSIGAMTDGSTRFHGLIDEIRIYNKPMAVGEHRLLAEQMSHAGEVPRVLPLEPDVTVEEGATLKIAAQEVVRALCGAGAVKIASQASFSAANLREFTGSISGNGSFAIPDGATLTVATKEELPRVSIGGVLSIGKNVTIDTAINDCAEHLLLKANSLDGKENIVSWKVMINGIDKKGFIAVKNGNEVWFTPKPTALLIIVR